MAELAVGVEAARPFGDEFVGNILLNQRLLSQRPLFKRMIYLITFQIGTRTNCNIGNTRFSYSN